MKLSFASVFLALSIGAASAGDVRVTQDDGPVEFFWPIDAQESTITEWYGYNDPDGDGASANTPEGIEDVNRNDISIVSVQTDTGTSIAILVDSPKHPDSTNNKVTLHATCEGACSTFPAKSFWAVKDDGGDLGGYVTDAGPPESCTFQWHWAPCCTDGAASRSLTGHFKLCLTFTTDVWDNFTPDDGIYFYNALERIKIEDIPAVGTSSSTICIEHGAGGVIGDPHFELWNGNIYDFHGACDMVLVESENFADNQDLKVHIRTSIRGEYSFVDTAVLKIGDDKLEVTGFGGYVINGVMDAPLPKKVGGFEVTHTQVSKKVHTFEVLLGGDEKIVIKTVKDMVSVTLDFVNAERLQGSRGMLGDYKTSEMLARNGTVVIEDPNAFAMDWQVKEGEEMLFAERRYPQHPEQCTLPTVTSNNRRLGATIAREAAEKACANWHPHFRAACVADVMATGDLEIAAEAH